MTCPKAVVPCAYRLFDFFRELPATVEKLRPRLMAVFSEDIPLEQILNVRQWQMSIVFLSMIAKKYKVCKAMLESVCGVVVVVIAHTSSNMGL